MKVLRSRIAFAFLSAFVMSVLFVVAIPTLCLSAGHSTALMVISIVLLGVGLPAIPLLWLWYAKLTTLQSITATIEEDMIYEIDVIAARLHLSHRTVDRRIRRILRWRILRGYDYNSRFIHPTYRLGESEIGHCEHCGANYTVSDHPTRCPHCNASLPHR